MVVETAAIEHDCGHAGGLGPLGDEGPGLRVDSRRSVPLWDGPWALLLALIGLGGEALLRRRAGLR